MDDKSLPKAAEVQPSDALISSRRRKYIIIASLLALFLGALDSLVMSAAMPTIVADLGGLALYSWVYSAYLLARAVALPIFGKLADIFRSRRLYIISICNFLAGLGFCGIGPKHDAADYIPRASGHRRRRKLCPGLYRIGRHIFTRETRQDAVPGQLYLGVGQRSGADVRRFCRDLLFLALDFFYQCASGCAFPAGYRPLSDRNPREKKRGGHRLLGSVDPFNRHPGIVDRFSAGRALLRLGIPANYRLVNYYHCCGHGLFLCRTKGPGADSFPEFFWQERFQHRQWCRRFWPVL